MASGNQPPSLLLSPVVRGDQTPSNAGSVYNDPFADPEGLSSSSSSTRSGVVTPPVAAHLPPQRPADPPADVIVSIRNDQTLSKVYLTGHRLQLQHLRRSLKKNSMKKSNNLNPRQPCLRGIIQRKEGRKIHLRLPLLPRRVSLRGNGLSSVPPMRLWKMPLSSCHPARQTRRSTHT